MNFDYTDEQKELKSQARRVLAQHAGAPAARRVMAGESQYSEALWAEMAKLGWLGAAIPEEFGGAGLGPVTLCAIAEELGRALAPVPTVSSIYLAAQALLVAGNDAQWRAYLPGIASGATIATLACVEGAGPLRETLVSASVRDSKLTGTKLVPDGLAAALGIVVAKQGSDTGLYVVDLRDSSVTRESLPSIDPSRPWTRVRFAGTAVEPLGGKPCGWATLERILQRASIMLAFEQLGGADRCLELARDYALEREAFGRVIGQYQAVKHRLADMYVANELARSNAYYGAWALETKSPELPMAAAVSRIAATEAFERAARDYTQTLGGISATWAHDAHLYLRRSRHLAALLGSAGEWRERLVTCIDRTVAA